MIDFRFWHETDMLLQSPHVCCWGQSGPHLLEGSISQADIENTLTARALKMAPQHRGACWMWGQKNYPSKATLLSLVVLFCSPYAAMAADIAMQDGTVMTAERPVTAKRYAAAGKEQRPAVLILHGRSGLAPKPRFAAAYERYAIALANVGIDAYLISYLNESDGKAMLNNDDAFRASVRSQRYPVWIGAIRDIAHAISTRPEATGRVGLLGFSLGGNLAAATAATDSDIAALAVFYGAMPETMTERVLHFPPTLELHGDADKEAPLAAERVNDSGTPGVMRLVSKRI